MDLLMGRFADAEIGGLAGGDLDDFETLMHVPDSDLFAWITERSEVPADYDTAVMRQIIAFYNGPRSED